jgi:predicted ATPase
LTEQKLRDQAETLYEREQEELREQAERRKEADREQGIRSHISRIQKQRDEERRAQARRAAAAEAESLSIERYTKAERCEELIVSLDKALAEYADIHDKHVGAMVRAGLDREELNSLRRRFRAMIPTWVKDRLGGHNSITGIGGSRRDSLGHSAARIPMSLAERDELASPVSGYDEKAGA